MRKLKIILLSLGSLLLVCIILTAVFIFTINESTLSTALERITGYTVSIDGPVSLDIAMEPSLSVSGITIESREDEEDRISANIGHIRTKIALKPLLSRIVLVRELIVDDVSVSYVVQRYPPPVKSDETNLLEKLSSIAIPVIETVRLHNFGMSYKYNEPDYSVDVLLDSFTVDDMRDAGPLYVKGSGAVNSTAFSVDGQMGSFADVFKQDLPFPVDLTMSITDLTIGISGTVDDPLSGNGMNILVTADETEFSNMLEVLQVPVPELGRLDLEARITGNINFPRISVFSFDVSGDPQVELSAEGSITNLLTGEGAEIALSGSTAKKALIRTLIPETLIDISELTFEGVVHNVQGDYTLKDATFFARKGKETTLRADGTVLLGRYLYDPEITIDLKLRLDSENTKVLRSFLFQWLPDTGPLSGQAKVTGSVKEIALENISITAGKEQSVWINAQGQVGSIPFGADQRISGIDMSLSVKAAKVPQLFANVNVDVPELDHISGQTLLHGSADSLIFDGINIQMQDRGGVAADISGNFLLEARKDRKSLGTYDLSVNVTAESVASFRRLLAAEAIPDLKPAKASAQVTGTTEIMSLDDVLIQAGHSDQVNLEWRGRIGTIRFDSDRPVSDVEITGMLQTKSTSQLSPYVGVSVPDLGPFKGTANIVAAQRWLWL